MIVKDQINNFTEDRAVVYAGFDDPKAPLETMMLKYNRYGESQLIIEALGAMGVCVNKLLIEDFGCGIGDHGMVFLRRGCRVIFSDKRQSALNFVEYRCKLENLPFNQVSGIPDLIIYSKVLEDGFNDPWGFLMATKAKYIFTSNYPTADGDDDRDECLRWMRDRFAEVNLSKKRRLWVRAP